MDQTEECPACRKDRAMKEHPDWIFNCLALPHTCEESEYRRILRETEDAAIRFLMESSAADFSKTPKEV